MDVVNFLSSVSVTVSAVMLGASCFFILSVLLRVIYKVSGEKIRKNNKYFSLFFLSIVVVALAVRYYMDVKVVDVALKMLERGATIQVDGKKVVIQREIMRSFNHCRQLKNAGSGSTRVYTIQISDIDGSLFFLFKRDSADASLYWVFFPKYKGAELVCYANVRGIDKIQTVVP